MVQLSNYEQQALNKFGQTVLDGKWSNEGLVQLIELVGNFLNMETIPDYAKRTKMSYNGVKNNRQIIEIFNVKFVIDNE